MEICCSQTQSADKWVLQSENSLIQQKEWEMVKFGSSTRGSSGTMYVLGEHWGDSAAADAGLSGCVVDFNLPQFLSLPVKPLLV